MPNIDSINFNGTVYTMGGGVTPIYKHTLLVNYQYSFMNSSHDYRILVELINSNPPATYSGASSSTILSYLVSEASTTYSNSFIPAHGWYYSFSAGATHSMIVTGISFTGDSKIKLYGMGEGSSVYRTSNPCVPSEEGITEPNNWKWESSIQVGTK